jgi:hypothetical protein
MGLFEMFDRLMNFHVDEEISEPFEEVVAHGRGGVGGCHGWW